MSHWIAEPSDFGGYATRNYEEKDLQNRLEILEQIKAKSITEPETPPHPRRVSRQRQRSVGGGGR